MVISLGKFTGFELKSLITFFSLHPDFETLCKIHFINLTARIQIIPSLLLVAVIWKIGTISHQNLIFAITQLRGEVGVQDHLVA